MKQRGEKERIRISALVKKKAASGKSRLLAQDCGVAAVQLRKRAQSLEPWNSFDFLPVNETKQCQAQDCTPTQQISLGLQNPIILLITLLCGLCMYH